MEQRKIITESIDLTGVGQVDSTWDFDVEEYQEWLNDEGYQDNQESFIEYIRDNVEFELELFDNDTYHHLSFEVCDYEDLESEFGEDMTNRIVDGLKNDGQYSFETSELYNSQKFDVNNPQELNKVAMQILNHGEYYKGCRGFILTNGVIVYTPAEHNMVSQIDGIKDTFDFIRKGNIRILNQSIDLEKEPTEEQKSVLRTVIASYSDEELYLDIFTESGEISAYYHKPDWRFVMGEINRYFREGIKPQGNTFGEGKKTRKKLIESEDINSFKSWFGDSVLVDKEGNPVKMYHGTDQTFNAFSKKHIGSSGSYEGYGFNFTPFLGRAESYNNKNVIEAYLRAESPMTTKSNKITLNQLIIIINEIDKGKPFTDTIVAAYEPTKYGEKWNEIYYKRALPIAAKMIYEYNKENEYGDAGIYSDICLNGNGDVNKVISTFEKFGYDSVIHFDDNGRINTVVVFEPNQIKRVGNKTYSRDSDVMDESIIKEVSEGPRDLFSLAKNHFGITNDIRECGYILPSGEMLDFSGRHEVSRPSDAIYLNGNRALDHKDIQQLNWEKDGNTPTNANASMEDFIKLGAIRINPSSDWCTINLLKKPTKEQIDILLRLIRYSRGNATVEIGDGNKSLSFAQYKKVRPSRIIGDINRYFNEGINLMSNINENVNIKGNEIRLFGMCDNMVLTINNKQSVIYSYKDSKAYPFIIYGGKLFIGESEGTHGELMLSITGAFKNYDEMIEGRIWVSAKVNEFNYAVVAFWGTNNNTDCKPFVFELAKKLKVNPNKIVIAITDNVEESDIDIVPLNEWNGQIHKMSDEEKEEKALHMMNAQEKHDNTDSFRKSRDKRIGQKLTNDKGEEMPMAQYHNLIYQENKENKNKKILVTEEQYNRLFDRTNKEITITEEQYRKLFVKSDKTKKQV